MLTALCLDEVEVADAKGKSSRWYHQGGITAPDNFLNQICTAQAPQHKLILSHNAYAIYNRLSRALRIHTPQHIA